MFTPLFTHSFVHLSKINLLFIQSHADVMQTCYTCNNCIWLTDGEFLIWLKPMITNLEHLLEKINCICFQLYILQKKMNIFFTFDNQSQHLPSSDPTTLCNKLVTYFQNTIFLIVSISAYTGMKNISVS